MSSPSVAAALALAETRRVSGRDADPRRSRSPTRSRAASASVAPAVPPARLSSDRALLAVRHRLRRGEAARARRAGAGLGRRHRAAAPRRELLECWVDGTQTKFLHSGFAAQSGMSAAMLRAGGRHRAAEDLRGTLRAVRVAPAGPGGAEAPRANRRRARHALGEPQLVVQAVSRGARAAPVHLGHPAPARARPPAGGRRAHRVPGGRVQRVDRVRAGRGEACAGDPGALPRVPAVHAGRGARTREAGPGRLRGSRPPRPGDPGAGADASTYRVDPEFPARAASRARCVSRWRMAAC